MNPQRLQNDQNVVATIIEFGLCIRQIPLEVVSKYDYSEYKPGDCLEELPIDYQKNRWTYEDFKRKQGQSKGYVFDDECQRVVRLLVVRKTVPDHAGYWMCKLAFHTQSMVQWNKKTDNLAPTLQQSIDLFRAGLT